MLKWTVTKRAEPIVQFTAVLDRRATSSPSRVVSQQSLIREIREHRRRCELTKRYRNRNKENAIVASPHPLTIISRNPRSTSIPNNQSTALTDVSNRKPDIAFCPAAATPNTTPIRKRNLPPSPMTTIQLPIDPMKQSTPDLPPGKALALRGLTVPNSYFESPRLPPPITIFDQPSPAKRARIDITPLSRRLGQLRFSKVAIQRHAMFEHHLLDEEEDLIDMSSKSLDNTDLDRMIDDILQSTRKCKPIPAPKMCVVPAAPHASPNSKCYNKEPVGDAFATRLESIEESMIALDDITAPTFNIADKSVQADECHLRRQGGVRRKHTARRVRCHRHSLQTDQSQQLDRLMLDHPYLRKSIELLAAMDTPKEMRCWL